MSDPAVTTGAALMCPHGGTIAIATRNVRVLAGGAPIATITDGFSVADCPFVTESGPLPCVSIAWTASATRVLIDGQPPILQTSTGLALGVGGIASGLAIIAATQSRVTMR